MKRTGGFTLIEVMVTVVILSILAMIALPSYRQYVLRAHRSEGIALLNEAAARQEQYFAQNNAYVTATGKLTSLALRNSGTSDNAYYQLQITAGADDDGGYLLTAKAQNSQASDSECGDLTLNAVGTRGSSGTGAVSTCWK